MKNITSLLAIIPALFVSLFITNTSYADTHFNKEERVLIVLTSHTELGTTDIVPFLLQDKFIELGTTFIEGKAWQENVVVEGRLITGQNPASAKKVA